MSLEKVEKSTEENHFQIDGSNYFSDTGEGHVFLFFIYKISLELIQISLDTGKNKISYIK